MHKENKNNQSIFFTIVISSILIVCVVIGSYFFVFPYSIENTKSDWGAFGDFIGGTLNPVFGFMGLMAILLTLRLQIKEMSLTREQLTKSAQALEQAKEISKKELEQIIKEEIKNDLNRVIREFYKNIETYLNNEITINGIFEEKPRRYFFDAQALNLGKNNNLTTVRKNKKSLINALDSDEDINRKYISSYLLFSSANHVSDLILEFSEILKEYESLSTTKTITYFYKKRLLSIVYFLNQHSLIDKKIHLFYKKNPFKIHGEELHKLI